MRYLVSASILVAILLLAACGGSTPPGNAMSGEITVAGSTTVQPLAEVLGEAFTAAHPDLRVTVQGGGSSVGAKSAGQGTVDVGTASREIKDSELQEFPDLQVYTIARDGIAVITNPGVPVDDLTQDQVREIYSGQITNWSELGGPDTPIVVVSREEGSGTRSAFEEMVMGEEAVIVDTAILQPSNGAVKTTVSTTPDSIGYLSFGYLDESVKAVAVDGVDATEENAANGSYPVIRPLNMLTKGEPGELAGAWLDFILGSDGQAIVVEEGYIAVQ
jgi:phosphate transport system substrate-binding protein